MLGPREASLALTSAAENSPPPLGDRDQGLWGGQMKQAPERTQVHVGSQPSTAMQPPELRILPLPAGASEKST